MSDQTKTEDFTKSLRSSATLLLRTLDRLQYDYGEASAGERSHTLVRGRSRLRHWNAISNNRYSRYFAVYTNHYRSSTFKRSVSHRIAKC
jgi:hypothetical protein